MFLATSNVRRWTPAEKEIAACAMRLGLAARRSRQAAAAVLELGVANGAMQEEGTQSGHEEALLARRLTRLVEENLDAAAWMEDLLARRVAGANGTNGTNGNGR
jgi:hypothetical protein